MILPGAVTNERIWTARDPSGGNWPDGIAVLPSGGTHAGMNEVDHARPDREVGSMLSGDEVERLREAIGWLRGQRGLRLKDIALGCDAAEHTVRNFAYRKSIRPDNAFLGKV